MPEPPARPTGGRPNVVAKLIEMPEPRNYPAPSAELTSHSIPSSPPKVRIVFARQLEDICIISQLSTDRQLCNMVSRAILPSEFLSYLLRAAADIRPSNLEDPKLLIQSATP